MSSPITISDSDDSELDTGEDYNYEPNAADLRQLCDGEWLNDKVLLNLYHSHHSN